MKNYTFILTLSWLLYNLSDYYLYPFFLKPFAWLGVCATLIFLAIRQFIKIFKEFKDKKITNIFNFSITSIFLLLSFYNFGEIPNSMIEKIDWNISYNKRNEIVQDVLAEKL